MSDTKHPTNIGSSHGLMFYPHTILVLWMQVAGSGGLPGWGNRVPLVVSGPFHSGLCQSPGSRYLAA